MSSHRSKEHHTTPLLLLRGFADRDAYGPGDGRIVMHDLKTGETHQDQRIKKVTYQRNFYSVRTHGDSDPLDDGVERWLCSIESDVTPLLERAATGGARWTEEELTVVTLFVALQLLRVPSTRELWKESSESFDRIRRFFPGLLPNVADKEDAIAAMLRQATPYAVELASAYTPYPIRRSSHAFLTSDNPVALISDGSSVSVTLRTAGFVFLAIDSATGLLFWNHECWGKQPVATELEKVDPVALNRAVVAQSRRQILWHPETRLEDLLGTDFEWPPYRERLATGQDENLAKMAQALEWGAEHPDQPHPSRRLPKIEVDPSARPLDPELRRRLSANGFFD